MSAIEQLQELDKQGIRDTPEARTLAEQIYDNELPPHHCYWNDRLYIALAFGLDEERTKSAVVNSIVANGRTEYFEPFTHFRFDLRTTLEERGFSLSFLSETPKPRSGDYYALPDQFIEEVTTAFGIEIQNVEELRRLQGDYQHSSSYDIGQTMY